MQAAVAVIALAIIAFVRPAAAAEQTTRYDGGWSAVLDCPSNPTTALHGYTYVFEVSVKQGVLLGQYGIKGRNDSVSMAGVVRPDGSALITATGLTGNPKATIGHIPEGSPYTYHIRARFEAARGSGERIGGRACTLTLNRL